jgi:hypothetical protein
MDKAFAQSDSSFYYWQGEYFVDKRYEFGSTCLVNGCFVTWITTSIKLFSTRIGNYCSIIPVWSARNDILVRY